MLPAVEHHVLVDLVGEHRDVPTVDELGQSLEVGALGGGAGGIVGTVEEDEARAGIQRRAYALPVVAEARLDEWEAQAARAREPHGRLVGGGGRIEANGPIARR